MEKTCVVSGKKFIVTDEDLAFYETMGVPAPTICPEERRRRRHAYRNESSLYHRVCDGTGKKIISMHSPDKPYPVYDNDYWWGDQWDPKAYGVDLNFDQPFFTQFKKIAEKVPRMARIQQGENANSRFTNCASYNKNCYLIFSSNRNEDCMYSKVLLECKDTVDCFYCYNLEIGYQNIHCTASYNVRHCEKVHFSQNMWYCADCRNSENCFACVAWWGKKNGYWVLNEKVTQDKFEALLKDVKAQKEVLKKLPALYQSKPQRYSPIIKCENSSGAYLRNNKNAQLCWDCEDLEDCKFCDNFFASKSCYDVSYFGCTQTNELLYECQGVGHGLFNSAFCKTCWGGSQNLQYCYECFKCEDCFGCVGLKNAKYCLFNTQYSKEDYFNLRAQVIEHMKSTNEYGEFFPIEICAFGYNETVAQDYFPLSKEEALSKDYNWREETEKTTYDGPQYKVPESIESVDESICDQILTCEKSGQNYRIVKPEYAFYKKHHIPIPRLCPEERHQRRLKRKHPRRLWDRTCLGCKTDIQSPIDPALDIKIYCDSCFLDQVN